MLYKIKSRIYALGKKVNDLIPALREKYGITTNPSEISNSLSGNQDKITHYLTLRNKADMEIEATGWVSEETDDALEAIELTLTPQEINVNIS